MLKKCYKAVLIFSLSLACSNALANNFTHHNVNKAKEIFKNVVSYYGGKKAINELNNVLTDYDYSTNYRTQGYGYQDSEYHSNRPGNTLSLISFNDKLNWTQTQSQYLKAFYSRTSLYQDNTRFDYNNITRTFATKKASDFDKQIESQLLRNPLLIVKSAIKQKDNLRYLGSKTRDGKRYSLIAMTLPSGRVITTYIDQSNHQIVKIEFLNDGKLSAYSYSDYQSAGPFKLPFFITRNLPDNYYSAYFYYHVSRYDFSPDVEQLAVVPKGYLVAEKYDTYDGELRMQTIGKGLYWLTQNGANTIFVEFSDHIMTVDANNGRNDGLQRRINKFRKLVPNKPIKYVSLSHQHHDHLDQVPFYANQGTKLITAKSFIPLINKRINAVNKNETVKPTFEVVDKKRVYADKTQRVEIYELKNMLHAETMLMTYFPNEQLIYLPDHYEEMYLIENHHAIKVLLAEISRLGLTVKGFIQGHGNDIYSLATLEAAMAKTIEMKKFRRQPHHSVTHSE